MKKLTNDNVCCMMIHPNIVISQFVVGCDDTAYYKHLIYIKKIIRYQNTYLKVLIDM